MSCVPPTFTHCALAYAHVTSVSLCRCISSNEVSAVANAVFNWTITSFGMVNIDKMFENKIGDLLAERLPYLPDRGKTDGGSRDWRSTIHWLFLNRRKTSSQKLYQRHSVHEELISTGCKSLMAKGLPVHVHADGEYRFAVQGRNNSPQVGSGRVLQVITNSSPEEQQPCGRSTDVVSERYSVHATCQRVTGVLTSLCASGDTD